MNNEEQVCEYCGKPATGYILKNERYSSNGDIYGDEVWICDTCAEKFEEAQKKDE